MRIINLIENTEGHEGCAYAHALPFTNKRLLVKENGETKYPEGKLVNYRDWQIEPDYNLNSIYKFIII